MCITFARGKVTRFQLAGNDRLDEAVLEISTSYFQLFVPGSSLRGICETWIIAHLVMGRHQGPPRQLTTLWTSMVSRLQVPGIRGVIAMTSSYVPVVLNAEHSVGPALGYRGERPALLRL